MTPEQKALRERILRALATSVNTSIHDQADEVMEKIPGLRVVAEDEVVVKRAHIREGWWTPPTDATLGVWTASNETIYGEEPIGVI